MFQRCVETTLDACICFLIKKSRGQRKFWKLKLTKIQARAFRSGIELTNLRVEFVLDTDVGPKFFIFQCFLQFLIGSSLNCCSSFQKISHFVPNQSTTMSFYCFYEMVSCKFMIVTNPIITTQIEPRKKPSYFPLYWMVNRDPYDGLL